jgi:hypothetical protein
MATRRKTTKASTKAKKKKAAKKKARAVRAAKPRTTRKAASRKPARRLATATGLMNDERLRRRLARLVTVRLRATIPGICAHVGEDRAQSHDPEAVIYRRTGAHFRWVAFAFAPWRMWDLHVGVVAVDERSLSVGLHISERAAKLLLPRLRRLGTTVGAKAAHMPRAIEYQANLPKIDVTRTTLPALAGTIVRLCPPMARLARAVAPPAAMRARGA